jgi:hypothetical protein
MLMALTQVGAIYATQTKLLQRIYIPHGDDSEIAQQHVHPMESLLLVPITVYEKGGVAAVQAAVGKSTTDGYCFLHHKDTGEILGAIIWDVTVHGHVHPEGHRVVPRGT